MTRTPQAFDPERGREAVAGLGVTGALAELVSGAAGCSPYLTSLFQKERDWILGGFDNPEAVLDALFTEVQAMQISDLNSGLRQAKRRIALLAALADLGGVWSLEDVTGALTRLADVACHVALTRLIGREIERGKVPGQTQDDIATAGGVVALAMGKMGAGELNYSSDIDLIVLFDETRFDPDDAREARSVFVKATRKMAQLLNDVTGEGYVFRTDLRLRPDASVTPVCLSMAAAEAYYEGVGRTWERAAYIKARPCAGDIEAGNRFLETLRPFVWRKHLDFAAIEDAHSMRLRIREHKGLAGELSLPGHNMKLGRGGIREIEFFTQTRQLIAGGRDPSLRVRGTVDGLARLVDAGWVETDVAEKLTRHYRAHREVEHRLQMINDAQTHDLPKNDEGFARLAAFMGKEEKVLRSELTERLDEVHVLTEGFFSPGEAPDPVQGFGEDIVARWPGYPALRSDRAAAIFRRLRPEILGRLQKAAKPDEALANFDRFLVGLPAGVQLFSLFEANPQLTQLMVDICATAPALAEYLSHNVSVFDAVIGGAFFDPWPEGDDLICALQQVLAPVQDYEGQLDAARRWMKEWHFRIGVHHLRGLINSEEAGLQYADLAAAVVACIWPVVTTQFSEKHGPPPGRGAVIIGMGSLGAGRLNARSDLDLIVIYDGADVDASNGPRPLSTRPYYARLTQAMITALTAPMAEGRLYEVDMRLRPSGRQGPVATSLAAFESYQMEQAWTWEHLALTRARVVAGPEPLAADVEAIRRKVLKKKSKGKTVRKDVAEMRERIAAARPGKGGLEVKAGPGRLQDVELAGQTLALLSGSSARTSQEQIEAGVASGLINAAQGKALHHALSLCWQVQAVGRLLAGDVASPEVLGEGGCKVLLAETEYEDIAALSAALEQKTQAAEAVVRTIVGKTDER